MIPRPVCTELREWPAILSSVPPWPRHAAAGPHHVAAGPHCVRSVPFGWQPPLLCASRSVSFFCVLSSAKRVSASRRAFSASSCWCWASLAFRSARFRCWSARPRSCSAHRPFHLRHRQRTRSPHGANAGHCRHRHQQNCGRCRQAGHHGVSSAPACQPLYCPHLPRTNRLAIQPAPQVFRQGGAVGVAIAGPLGHRLQTNRLQILGNLGLDATRRLGSLVQVIENHCRRRTAEGSPSAQQLVQHHAQAILIAGRPHFAQGTVGLLRGHVGGRAHHRTILGQLLSRTFQVRQPKVHQEQLGRGRRSSRWPA